MFCRTALCENDKYVKLPRRKAAFVSNRTAGGFQLVKLIAPSPIVRFAFIIGLMSESEAIALAI